MFICASACIDPNTIILDTTKKCTLFPSQQTSLPKLNTIKYGSRVQLLYDVINGPLHAFMQFKHMPKIVARLNKCFMFSEWNDCWKPPMNQLNLVRATLYEIKKKIDTINCAVIMCASFA